MILGPMNPLVKDDWPIHNDVPEGMESKSLSA
jgi:hypothetical protein